MEFIVYEIRKTWGEIPSAGLDDHADAFLSFIDTVGGTQ
jgi:hypothetical protein